MGGSETPGGCGQMKCARPSQWSAIRRLMAILPILEFRLRLRSGARPSAFRYGSCLEVGTQERLSALVASRHGVCRATIWNWLQRYDKHGLEGLANRRRSDRGRSRFFDHNPDAASFVLASFQARAISAAAVYRELLAWWTKTTPPPSYTTVRIYLWSSCAISGKRKRA